MRGYKVVSYSDWQSLPEIFGSLMEAKKAKQGWKLGNRAIIESFNSKSSRAKQIKDIN